MKLLSKLYNYLYSFVTATPIISDNWRFSHTPVDNKYYLLSIEKLLYQTRKARGHQTELDIIYDNIFNVKNATYDNVFNKDITDVV